MREIVRFETHEAMPELSLVLANRHMPEPAQLPARVRAILEEAIRLYAALAEPTGLYEELAAGEFETVYRGQGWNPPLTPLGAIYPRAEGLALFAATLGPAASEKISELFREHDLALAYLLDAVASEGADRLSERLARRYGAALRASGTASERTRVLPYSPGYCGWHVSGQGRLFERLRPAEIGISLNDSFLMSPLKSVSGVLIAGPGPIHKFRPDFPFCESCETRECRWRMASVLKEPETGHGSAG